MSMSKHQRYSTNRNHKHPRAILDIYIKDGRKCVIWEYIRLKPYGHKNFIGHGEENIHINMDITLQLKHVRRKNVVILKN